MIWGCGGTNFIPARHEVQNYNLRSSGNPHMEFWGEGEVIAAQGEWMESKATDGVLHHRMYKDGAGQADCMKSPPWNDRLKQEAQCISCT